VNSGDSYLDASCEHGTYESPLKKSKRKSPVLAAICGFFFGPFGMLYLGWAVFLTTVTGCFLAMLSVALLSPFRIPEWIGLIVNLFFAVWGFVLASVHNDLAEGADDSTSLAGMNLVGVNAWLIRVIVVTAGLYSMVMFFSEGRWIVAVLTPIIFIPVVIWCVDGIFSLLAETVLLFSVGVLRVVWGVWTVVKGRFGNELQGDGK